jgi:hypothetical protein
MLSPMLSFFFLSDRLRTRCPIRAPTAFHASLQRGAKHPFRFTEDLLFHHPGIDRTGRQRSDPATPFFRSRKTSALGERARAGCLLSKKSGIGGPGPNRSAASALIMRKQPCPRGAPPPPVDPRDLAAPFLSLRPAPNHPSFLRTGSRPSPPSLPANRQAPRNF